MDILKVAAPDFRDTFRTAKTAIGAKSSRFTARKVVDDFLDDVRYGHRDIEGVRNLRKTAINEAIGGPNTSQNPLRQGLQGTTLLKVK